MSETPDNSVRFEAITFGVDRDTDTVCVGFEMDRRPDRDSRGLILSRATPEHSRDHGDGIYVEFGEPQQYGMDGGIASARSTAGHFSIQFTEDGAKQMAGIRAIEVNYDKDAEVVPDLLNALDYIFEGFAGYNTDDVRDAD